ncbi:hypothetical protein RN347_16280 [Halomonas sp. PAMB 3264]|uniref:hypothetical protein n=1 Tax=Halomonas sp. PAMB 3264 TaxID=3075222 RepID=UPI0028A1352B|nr:hypothetical protein [Halomonas sp. PAMB 3264]WNL42159.1 hypothetical protein RN347_16280 [Halomonas sp. PAMB 3264]
MTSHTVAAAALGVAGLFVFATAAQAARYPVSDDTAFGAWHAATTTDAGQRHFRALEAESYSDAILSVNATEGVCHLPWLELRVTLKETQSESRAVNLVPARLRVDQTPIMETMAEFIVEEGDDGFYSHFYLGELDALLARMSEGEQLFIGFEQGSATPWTMTFDLDGAGKAIQEMQRRCAGA